MWQDLWCRMLTTDGTTNRRMRQQKASNLNLKTKRPGSSESICYQRIFGRLDFYTLAIAHNRKRARAD